MRDGDATVPHVKTGRQPRPDRGTNQHEIENPVIHRLAATWLSPTMDDCGTRSTTTRAAGRQARRPPGKNWLQSLSTNQRQGNSRQQRSGWGVETRLGQPYPAYRDETRRLQ